MFERRELHVYVGKAGIKLVAGVERMGSWGLMLRSVSDVEILHQAFPVVPLPCYF